jgi:hypothetical protein
MREVQMITRRNFLIGSAAVSASLMGKNSLADKIMSVDEPNEVSFTVSNMQTEDYSVLIDCHGESLDAGGFKINGLWTS